LDRIPHGEARLYRGMLIQCQSYLGDYAYPFGEVAVSVGDGMGSYTHVPVVRHTWVPAATSCCTRHIMLPLPKARAPIEPTQYRKPTGEADGSLRASRAGVKRWSRLTGGEILSAHDYLDDGVYLAWIAPEFHSF
jgi:hypothetical protein